MLDDAGSGRKGGGRRRGGRVRDWNDWKFVLFLLLACFFFFFFYRFFGRCVQLHRFVSFRIGG